MIRGIGPVYAKKLLRAFGEKVFDVIEAEPNRLQEVDGIGPLRAGRITAAWAEQKAVREIMVFLHSHGVGTARAVRIYKAYGGDAVQVMSENPYRLARDIRGIGFKTADAIAMKLGVDKTAMVRVRAGVSYALSEAMDEGHCGLPTDDLVPLAEQLPEVPQKLIRAAAGASNCANSSGLLAADAGVSDEDIATSMGACTGMVVSSAWMRSAANTWARISRTSGMKLAEFCRSRPDPCRPKVVLWTVFFSGTVESESTDPEELRQAFGRP